MKVWTSTEKDNDKIIVYSNETIYKANPPLEKVEEYLLDLKIQNTPSVNYLGIPLRYISEINLQEGKKYIEVVFKGDYEHFKIKDDKIRTEIFDFFRQNIPGVSYSIIKQSKLQAIKKPLIAIGVICVIFSWSLYIAIGMEAGNSYDVTGQHYDSIAGIVLVIASLGVRNIILISGSLLLITGVTLIRKYKNPVVKKALTISTVRH